MPAQKEIDFTFEHTDEEGNKLEGSFTIRTSLSFADTQSIGRQRRALLGPQPIGSGLDEMDYLRAQWQVELAVRQSAAPAWYTKAYAADKPPGVVDALGRAMEEALSKYRREREEETRRAEGELRPGARK